MNTHIVFSADKDVHEFAVKSRIKQLERLINAGDATYTDLFELEELKLRLENAWRVFEGGREKKK